MGVGVPPVMPDFQRPACSVCIANYNGISYIDACLRSILIQDVDFPIEIIVHDDASTDGSTRYIRTHFPEIRLIESKENVGFCISNNRMAAEAKGEYLLFFNNDAELFPDALKTLYRHAQKETAVLTLPQYNAATGELIDRGELFDIFLNPIPNLDPERQDVGMGIGACLWLPKDLWNILGGFPSWFHSIAEDMFLCCAARLRGYPVRVINDSGYRHWAGISFGGGKVQDKRLSTSVRRRALSERNKTFVMTMCYPSPLFQLVFPFHLYLLLLEGVALSAINREGQLLRKIYIGVFLGLLKNYKKLVIYRRCIQMNRRASTARFLRSFQFLPQKLRMAIVYGIPEVT